MFCFFYIIIMCTNMYEVVEISAHVSEGIYKSLILSNLMQVLESLLCNLVSLGLSGLDYIGSLN